MVSVQKRINKEIKEKEGRKQRLQTITNPIPRIVPIPYIPPQQASYAC